MASIQTAHTNWHSQITNHPPGIKKIHELLHPPPRCGAKTEKEMKSEKAKEILNDGACHVSDGELLDGHRLGCTDLVYYSDAIEAIKAAEQEAEERMRQKAISAFDAMWFGDGDNKCDTCESGNCDDCECCASEFEPDYEYHRKNFIQKLNEE